MPYAYLITKGIIFNVSKNKAITNTVSIIASTINNLEIFSLVPITIGIGPIIITPPPSILLSLFFIDPRNTKRKPMITTTIATTISSAEINTMLKGILIMPAGLSLLKWHIEFKGVI